MDGHGDGGVFTPGAGVAGQYVLTSSPVAPYLGGSASLVFVGRNQYFLCGGTFTCLEHQNAVGGDLRLEVGYEFWHRAAAGASVQAGVTLSLLAAPSFEDAPILHSVEPRVMVVLRALGIF